MFRTHDAWKADCRMGRVSLATLLEKAFKASDCRPDVYTELRLALSIDQYCVRRQRGVTHLLGILLVV
jgi:hypothetical protein